MMELSWFSSCTVLEDWTIVFSSELGEESEIVRGGVGMHYSGRHLLTDFC